MARAKTMFHAIAAREPDLAEVLGAVNRGLCEEEGLVNIVRTVYLEEEGDIEVSLSVIEAP